LSSPSLSCCLRKRNVFLYRFSLFSGRSELKVRGIHTATIGSFPLENSVDNRKRCIKDLMSIGIDFPNYPQLVDMGKQFLDDLVSQDCGVINDDGGYMLVKEDIQEPATPPGLELYKWTVDYLKNEGALKKVRLKASITGPFTLASYVKTKSGTFPFNTAIADIEKVGQLSSIISESCRAFAENAYVISIDEPILSVIVGTRLFFKYGEKDIVETYNDLRRCCGERITGSHICGRISPQLAKMLLRTELDFLSHEFHDTPENFNVYNPKELTESEKALSVGCVSSRNPQIETVEEILKIMKRSKEYGADLIFTPDCGFKKLTVEGSSERAYGIATEKLRNMVEAASESKAII